MNPAESSSIHMHTAPQILFQAARAQPERLRFLEGERRVTLSKLARLVAGCAGHLRARGVAPGDHVAIFAPNSLDWIVSALGVQACGAAFVGVHAGSSADLSRHITAHSEAKLVVAAPEELARVGLRDLPAPILPLGSWPEADAATFRDDSQLDATACLFVLDELHHSCGRDAFARRDIFACVQREDAELILEILGRRC